MAEDKKSFILYADYIGVVRKLPIEKAGELFLTILEYVNDEDPVVEDLLLEVVFEPIKNQLRRDLKRWDSIREKRSEAGKASAEARKNAKNNQQTATNLTRVELREQTLTNSTVSVNDNVTVTVNDTVTVNEKGGKESLPPLNKDLSDKIMKYFKFNEVANFDKMRDIGAFLRCLQINNRIEYFERQFEAYTEYKKINDSFPHSFKKFLGSHDQMFVDGAWNAENWESKFETEKKINQNGKKISTSTNLRSNQQSDGRQQFGKL